MKDEYKEMVCRVRFIDGVPAKTYLSDAEIVRCKDCKNYLTDDGIGIMCQMHYYRVKPTDFCSWAERKEHETY